MSFTSFEFLWFFLAFLVLYAFVPSRYRRYLLLLGGLVFCWMVGYFTALSDVSLGSPEMRAAAAPGKAFLGLGTALSFAIISYMFGILIQNGGAYKRVFLILGAVVNVGALTVFKITGFLPVGVSYYIFACVAYLVDVFRGTIQAEQNGVDFVAYTTMFPKLLQGPITRYGEISTQLKSPKYTLRRIQSGLGTFIIGFAMKVLVADRLQFIWSRINEIGVESISTPLAWLGVLSFSIQLFIDWQGYSLMAIGIGRVLGFQLPPNFDSPYLAKSIGDFFRRWHMTLSRWFKDYLYIPLGGNRKGTARTIINILIVWLVTSLWHYRQGAFFNYLIWGMSIGLLIVLEKLWLGKRLQRLHVLPHLYVLLIIPLTWLCFATKNLTELGLYFTRLFPFFGTAGNVSGNDLERLLPALLPNLIAGLVLCFPYAENLLQRPYKSAVVRWIVSLLLAGLFWYAVYTLQQQGSNPLMYLY